MRYYVLWYKSTEILRRNACQQFFCGDVACWRGAGFWESSLIEVGPSQVEVGIVIKPANKSVSITKKYYVNDRQCMNSRWKLCFCKRDNAQGSIEPPLFPGQTNRDITFTSLSFRLILVSTGGLMTTNHSIE